MAGRKTLSHLLLAAEPVLRGRLRSKAIHLAARLAPDSYDATRALAGVVREGRYATGMRDLTTAGIVAGALVAELQDGQELDASESGRFLEFYVSKIKAMGLRSNSQLLQDVWVLFETRAKRDGFFVEFGALDGVALSNTFLLEQAFGWTGILVEPNPKYHASLVSRRRATVDKRCVWLESEKTLRMIECGELSTIAGCGGSDAHAKERRRAAQTFEVRTVSLNDLLAQHQAPRVIDFLSVDTEGSEYDILKVFNFDKYTPMTICVEHNHTESEQQIDRLLLSRGYRRCLPSVSRWDGWYLHASHA